MIESELNRVQRAHERSRRGGRRSAVAWDDIHPTAGARVSCGRQAWVARRQAKRRRRCAVLAHGVASVALGCGQASPEGKGEACVSGG